MNEKPCHRESCSFSVEVFGEADPSENKCLYPNVKWVRTEVDQHLECDACARLSIHGGALTNIRISRSKTSKITFRLHGSYNRPEGAAELCISLRVSRDNKWPRSLILQGGGYLCEAYQADGLTLEIAIPKDWQFDSFVANGRTIHSTIPVSAQSTIRLTASDYIDAKVRCSRFCATAYKGIILTSEAQGRQTIAEIFCNDYIELTLLGYDCCDTVCPSPGIGFRRNYRLSLVPTVFKGKVISRTGEATII